MTSFYVYFCVLTICNRCFIVQSAFLLFFKLPSDWLVGRNIAVTHYCDAAWVAYFDLFK